MTSENYSVIYQTNKTFLDITENVKPLCTLFPEIIGLELQHENDGCDFFSKILHLPDLVKWQLLKNYSEYRTQNPDLSMINAEYMETISSESETQMRGAWLNCYGMTQLYTF